VANPSHNGNALGDLTMAEQQQPQFRIQDNPSIVETYANKFLGSVFDGGAVSLTFGTIRVVVEKTGGGQPARSGNRDPGHPSLDALANGGR
jgi:hypothetical protein